jgi:hypothetical protein
MFIADCPIAESQFVRQVFYSLRPEAGEFELLVEPQIGIDNRQLAMSPNVVLFPGVLPSLLTDAPWESEVCAPRSAVELLPSY